MSRSPRRRSSGAPKPAATEAAPLRDEGLESARKIALQIPAPSALFSSCIRAIKNAEVALRDGDPNALKDIAVASSSFLVGVSPTLKAVFYTAAQNLYPTQLAELKPLNARGLIRLFTPSEVTSILAVTYLYRHLKKRFSPDDLEWITNRLRLHMEIGSLVGRTVRYIGSGNGFLIGGMDFVALGLLGLKDMDKYRTLIDSDEADRKLFSTKGEKAAYGCTHREVASTLARTMGFGLATCLGLANETPDSELDLMEEKLAEELLCWRIAIGLTESYHATGKAPEADENSEFYLPEEEAKVLNEKVAQILRDGPSLTWLTASKNSLPDDVKVALEITDVAAPAKAGTNDIDEAEKVLATPTPEQ